MKKFAQIRPDQSEFAFIDGFTCCKSRQFCLNN